MPGRGAEFLKLSREAKQIHERLGGRVVLVNWTNAGSDTGTFGYGLVFPDFPAWGRFADALKDAEWQAWSQKTSGTADPPATPLSQITTADEPGFDTDPQTTPTPGSVMCLSRSLLAPGRSTEQALSVAVEYKKVALSLGARSVSVRRTIYGGEATLAFAVVTLFESYASLGEWNAKLATDPAARRFVQTAFGPASPLVHFSQQTGRVVPL